MSDRRSPSRVSGDGHSLLRLADNRVLGRSSSDRRSTPPLVAGAQGAERQPSDCDALGSAARCSSHVRICAGYEASAWFGVGAPGGTPAEIVDKLNTKINAGLANPKIKARLAELGVLCLRAPPPISASSSPQKPRNGARSFRTVNITRNDLRAPIQF
jgi:hypothetical protein